MRILVPKAGEQVLDVGCGQGYFGHAIASEGAKVVGIDVAAELIRIAKEQGSGAETYLTMSAEKMTGLANNRFDAAICILALQNMKNMPAAVQEISRVLKPQGRAVIVLNHPAFRIPNGSSLSYDEKANISAKGGSASGGQYRKIYRYLSEVSQEVDMTQGVKNPKNKKFTYSYHHPLQVYFKAFAKAGLAVTRLEEWVSHKTSDKGPRKAAEDLARKEIPLFMCLELKKL